MDIKDQQGKMEQQKNTRKNRDTSSGFFFQQQ